MWEDGHDSGLSASPVSPDPPAARKWPPSRRLLRLGALAVAVVVVGAVIMAQRNPKPTMDAKDVGGIVDKKIGAAVSELQSAPAPGVDVYNAIRGPLVVIQAIQPGGAKSGSELGSGIIVNARGDILTALHVVQGAASIRVSFSDGSTSDATMGASDPDRDSAVLTAKQLPEMVVPAVLGSSNGVRIGDDTFAVGHPLGLL